MPVVGKTARTGADDCDPATRKGFKCRPLPLEIVREIVNLASSRELWKYESPVEWLKALASVSKDWCAATQTVLFSSFTFKLSRYSKTHSNPQEQIRRLEFLESNPDLAKYVLLLGIRYPILTPAQMIIRLRSTFPNVKSLEVYPKEAGLNSQSLSLFLEQFPLLEDLSLTRNNVSHAFSRSITFPHNIRQFTISGTCAAISKILNALASSPSGRTVRSLRLTYQDMDMPSFALCQEKISHLEQVELLEVDMKDGWYYSNFKEIDISFKPHPRMSFLRLCLFAISNVTIDILYHLFAGAVLPSLRSLELDISECVISRITIRSPSPPPGPPPRPCFEPFGSRIPKDEISILPETVSASLDKLRFVFQDRFLVKHSTTFFKLFGVSHREGVMQIEGEDLALH